MNEQLEYLDLLDDMDPSGFVYRYPVDKRERPVERPPFIDLTAFAAAGAAFEESVMRVVDILAREELLPVPDVELEQTVQDFAETVRAVRSALRFMSASGPAFSKRCGQLGLLPLSPIPEIEAARTKAQAHATLISGLESPMLRVLDLLLARCPAEAQEPDLAPAEIPPLPELRQGSPTETADSVLALREMDCNRARQDGARAEGAVRAAHARSTSWREPAARQLHSDLGRVLSRL